MNGQPLKMVGTGDFAELGHLLGIAGTLLLLYLSYRFGRTQLDSLITMPAGWWQAMKLFWHQFWWSLRFYHAKRYRQHVPLFRAIRLAWSNAVDHWASMRGVR